MSARGLRQRRADDGQEGVPLRLDPAVWDGLERLARAELRSVNAEIEYLLRDALAQRGIRPKPAPPGRRTAVPPVASDPLTRLKRRNSSASIANMLKMVSGYPTAQSTRHVRSSCCRCRRSMSAGDQGAPRRQPLRHLIVGNADQRVFT
jgi:hypothetical protein